MRLPILILSLNSVSTIQAWVSHPSVKQQHHSRGIQSIGAKGARPAVVTTSTTTTCLSAISKKKKSGSSPADDANGGKKKKSTKKTNGGAKKSSKSTPISRAQDVTGKQQRKPQFTKLQTSPVTAKNVPSQSRRTDTSKAAETAALASGAVIAAAGASSVVNKQRQQQQSSKPPASTSTMSSGTTTLTMTRGLTEEYEPPFYPKLRRKLDDQSMLGDLTGGRPGAIIETEDQLAIKDQILTEIETGKRVYPPYLNDDYGELQQDVEADYDIDDPTAIDAGTLGTWTIQDLRSRFPYEWDPNSGEPDPNLVEMNQMGVRYVEQSPKDEEGVEIGYDPIFGPSNPVDTRTILGAADSFMIDDRTRDDSMLQPQFLPGDPEIDYNQDVVMFRKSLDIMETYIDPFLPGEQPMEIPRHVARWHGYPEPVYFEPKNFTNNRFTDNPTNFNELTPYRARQLAVEMARAKNAEWMPAGLSHTWHTQQRAPYESVGTLVGSLQSGDCDPDLVEQIQPALDILGSCIDLLSIIENKEENTVVYRFAYHGLMKNKYGMSCWTQTLLQDCGVQVTGVVFETGFRKRDAAYDGGDPWYAPIF